MINDRFALLGVGVIVVILLALFSYHQMKAYTQSSTRKAQSSAQETSHE